ncbi:hypothetical protein [Candidatus Phytoplasma rubi]|uniref:hypothetical protein n=1 Tax=Candidatus Phytoplasma rubi TaxID=399025 RepID=UPI0022862AD0|nr:hypothetical protein [Candidatus Phytoplasma rubi]
MKKIFNLKEIINFLIQNNYFKIRLFELFQNFRHFLLFKNSLRLTNKLVFFLFQG